MKFNKFRPLTLSAWKAIYTIAYDSYNFSNV